MRRLLAACALLSGGLAAEQHDEQVLVQVSANVAASVQTESALTAGLQSRFVHKKKPYKPDCEGFPKLCQPPLSCQEAPVDLGRPFVEGGRPNYHSWCGLPYDKAAAECAAGNKSAYATMIHKAQLQMGTGIMSRISKYIENIDAHYCFSWGHCDNTRVTAHTTLEEMVAMCDERFGRENWEKITGNEVMEGMKPKAMGGQLMLDKGNKHLTHEGHVKFAMLSCAQGNYHCDTFYCRQEYCDKPEWEEKFGNLRHQKY